MLSWTILIVFLVLISCSVEGAGHHHHHHRSTAVQGKQVINNEDI